MTDSYMTDGLRRQFNVRIPMRDGVEISADITYPATTPARAVLVHTPYGKATPNAAAISTAYAEAGYAFVLSDVRGRGDSDGGPFVPYRHDGKDGADVIEWISAQPWCNGDVITWGGSYLGRSQWLMALEQPSALKAMIILVCPSDAFVEWPTGTQTLMLIHWHSVTDGRAVQLRPQTDWDKALRHLPIIDLDITAGFYSNAWREDLAHPTFDDYWVDIAYQHRYAEIDLPVLHISGWYDDEAVGTPRNFNGMRTSAASQGARQAQRMVMGPWGHGVNAEQKIGEIDFGPHAVIDQRALELSWLDRVLAGTADDFVDDNPVRIFVMGANEWRDEPTWPPPYVREVAYYLNEGGELNRDAPSGEPSSSRWRHDPFDPVPFLMPPSAAQLGGPDDYREVEKRDDVLVYSSLPLVENVEVIGPVRLRAFVATSAHDTDVVARLLDVHPDGYVQRLCDGIVRLRYRDGMDKTVEVEPDQIYEIDVDMWDTAHRFLAGHAIRLEITSSAFPKYDRNLGTGGDMITESDGVVAENRIWHDPRHPSRLVLQLSLHER